MPIHRLVLAGPQPPPSNEQLSNTSSATLHGNTLESSLTARISLSYQDLRGVSNQINLSVAEIVEAAQQHFSGRFELQAPVVVCLRHESTRGVEVDCSLVEQAFDEHAGQMMRPAQIRLSLQQEMPSFTLSGFNRNLLSDPVPVLRRTPDGILHDPLAPLPTVPPPGFLGPPPGFLGPPPGFLGPPPGFLGPRASVRTQNQNPREGGNRSRDRAEGRIGNGHEGRSRNRSSTHVRNLSHVRNRSRSVASIPQSMHEALIETAPLRRNIYLPSQGTSSATTREAILSVLRRSPEAKVRMNYNNSPGVDAGGLRRDAFEKTISHFMESSSNSSRNNVIVNSEGLFHVPGFSSDVSALENLRSFQAPLKKFADLGLVLGAMVNDEIQVANRLSDEVFTDVFNALEFLLDDIQEAEGSLICHASLGAGMAAIFLRVAQKSEAEADTILLPVLERLRPVVGEYLREAKPEQSEIVLSKDSTKSEVEAQKAFDLELNEWQLEVKERVLECTPALEVAVGFLKSRGSKGFVACNTSHAAVLENLAGSGGELQKLVSGEKTLLAELVQVTFDKRGCESDVDPVKDTDLQKIQSWFHARVKTQTTEGLQAFCANITGSTALKLGDGVLLKANLFPPRYIQEGTGAPVYFHSCGGTVDINHKMVGDLVDRVNKGIAAEEDQFIGVEEQTPLMADGAVASELLDGLFFVRESGWNRD